MSYVSIINKKRVMEKKIVYIQVKNHHTRQNLVELIETGGIDWNE